MNAPDHTDATVDALQSKMADLGFVVPVRVISEALRTAEAVAWPLSDEIEEVITSLEDDAVVLLDVNEDDELGINMQRAAALLRKLGAAPVVGGEPSDSDWFRGIAVLPAITPPEAPHA